MAFHSGFVSIVGSPNVGKSTLLNSLLGTKLSIVSSRPQTTREAIRGILNEPQLQVVFVDTPGWLDPNGAFQSMMKRSIIRSIHDDADALIWLLDPSALTEADKLFGEKLKKNGKPVIVVINKLDVPFKKETIDALVGDLRAIDAHWPIQKISAKTKMGLIELKSALLRVIPESPPYFPIDQITDRWERFFVAELIREQIFRRYEDEVPHASTVKIEEFTEIKGRKDVIKALIIVETEGQKGILIGDKGRAIKELGQSSRKEIEEILERPVYLELIVKVHKHWRSDNEFLKSLLAL